MNEFLLKAMSGVSVPFMKALLDGYDGFRGVRTLVDVGGSDGHCLKMIMKKCPDVRHGIKFDLLEVVAKAPTITACRYCFCTDFGEPKFVAADVTHVVGDMFKSILAGDAMFMKHRRQVKAAHDAKRRATTQPFS